MKHTKPKGLTGLPSWFDLAATCDRTSQFFDAVIEELTPLAADFSPTRDQILAEQLRIKLKEINLEFIKWSNDHIERMGQTMSRINKKADHEAVAQKVAKTRKRVMDAIIIIVSHGLSRATKELGIDASTPILPPTQKPHGLSPGQHLITPD